MCDGVRDRAPDVYYAAAGLEEAVGVGGEVFADATDAGFVGLVDVDAFLESCTSYIGMRGQVVLTNGW